MGPETEKRAPSAKRFKNFYWRPVAAIILTVSSAVVYYENQSANNTDQSPENITTHQVLSPDKILSIRPDLERLLSQTITIPELAQGPKEVEIKPSVTLLPSLTSPTPKLPDENNSPVNALSVESSQTPDLDLIHGWLTVAGWPEELIPQALAVIKCESTYNPNAVSPNRLYYGLFGLDKMWFTYAGEDSNQWADPIVNARTALKVYQYDIEKGQTPWTQWGCIP